MKEYHWDFYIREIDERPAAVFVNLTISEESPQEERPHLLTVVLPLKESDDMGMPTEEEVDRLVPLENSMTALVAEHAGGVCVGQNSSTGLREYFFYCSEQGAAVTSAIEQAASVNGYRDIECEWDDDAEWKFYTDFLFPDQFELQWIKDRHTIEHLMSHGEDLSTPREVDHWAFFSDEAARDSFTAKIQEQGFTKKEFFEAEDAPEGEKHGVLFTRMDAVNFEHIHLISSALVELAVDEGGSYDGWGTECCGGEHEHGPDCGCGD